MARRFAISLEVELRNRGFVTVVHCTEISRHFSGCAPLRWTRIPLRLLRVSYLLQMPLRQQFSGSRCAVHRTSLNQKHLCPALALVSPSLIGPEFITCTVRPLGTVKQDLLGFREHTFTFLSLPVLQSQKTVTPDQIRAVLPPNCTEYVEETYDIYLLPPGEDAESCQSYLRMRNRDGKYSLMFEVSNFRIELRFVLVKRI